MDGGFGDADRRPGVRTYEMMYRREATGEREVVAAPLGSTYVD